MASRASSKTQLTGSASSAPSAARGSSLKKRMRQSEKEKPPHPDQRVSGMGTWLGAERNQVLYSPVTGNYYFVPLCRRSATDPNLRKIVGNKVDITESVLPLVAHAVAGHLRRLATSDAFSVKGRRMLLRTAREVEKKAGIDASENEE